MKKLILILTIFVLTIPLSNAQEFSGDGIEVNQSEPILSKKNYLSYLILGDNDVVFSRNTIKKKPYLVRYDENLEIETKILLTPDIVPKRSYIESIIPFNGGLLLFYSKLDKSRKTNDLYVVTLSQDDLSTLQDETKIFGLSYTSKRNSGSFDIALSRDSSKLMAFANTPNKRSKGARDEVSVVVMDKDFEILWDDVLTIPYADKDFAISDYDVDNNGNVYVLGKHYKQKSQREKKKPIGTYKLIGFFEEGHDRQEFDLKLSNKFISDITYFVKGDGNILCSGLYSNTSTSGAAGAFYLEIENETLEVVVENLVEFDMDFLIQGLSERATKRTKKRASKGKNVELYSYEIRNLIEKEDGGLVMVAEQYYVRVTTTTTTNANGTTSTTTTYHYYYNDIVVVSFDEEGEIEWHDKIDKAQYSTNDGGYYSGFNMVVKGDKLHFYFVDQAYSVGGLDVDRSTDRKSYKANHFVHASIDLDGNKEVESMGEIQKREFRPVPKEFVSMRDGRSTIYLRGRKAYKIGRIIVE
ncbi:MAG: hypothetical protein ACI8SE_000374 [Bacteroidia bacterium]|jgi:hypothetical protein